MSALESYLSAKNNPDSKIVNQPSSVNVDSNQNSKIVITAPKNGTLLKQKSQKYTKSLVDMSAAASQVEINNPTSGNLKQKQITGSTMLQSMNDVGGSIANMSNDGDSENGYGSFNKSTYMDDYIMACDTKPNSNSNLGSNTNMSALGNSNTNISEVVMEGWVLRKKSLQSFKKYYMIAKRRQSKAGMLCFYKSERDPLSQPYSTIDLSECTDINSNTSVSNYSSQRYEFKLYLRKHDLLLATNSHETTQKWIDAIKSLLPRISKPAYDSLQQEVNALRVSEANLRVENSKLMELIDYYKKTVKGLEENNKQLESEISRLKDELSLFKLENSNQQITNNNMHIKSLNQNMTKNLDKIFNKVSEQEKIEDIFKNGIKNIDEKIDQYSEEVKETSTKQEENHQALSETLNSLKEMVEKRTQKLAKMVVDSQEKIQSISEANDSKLEANMECLKEIQTEVQRFAKDIPETMESTFKKILDEKLDEKLEKMSKEMSAMTETQAKLLELYTEATNQMNAKQEENAQLVSDMITKVESNMSAKQEESTRLVNDMITKVECHNIENKNIINLNNNDILSKLDDLCNFIDTSSKASSNKTLNSWARTFCLDDNEKFMKDVRIALADIETRISRVKAQEQSNHDIQTQLVKAMNDKIHFFQQHILSVITEKIRKFMIDEQENKKMDLTSLENRMDELKIIIDTYSSSLKCAVDPVTVELIDYQNTSNLRHSSLSLDREASIDSAKIESIENNLQKVLKEVSKYSSSMNMLSRQSSAIRLSSSTNLGIVSPAEVKNTTLELVGSINDSLLRIQDIMGSNETLSNDSDLQDQFNYIKTVLETNKTDLEKVFVKRRNIEFLTNQITSLKSERDLLVEEVNKLS